MKEWMNDVGGNIAESGLKYHAGERICIAIAESCIICTEFVLHGQFFFHEPEDGVCPGEYQYQLHEQFISCVS